MRFRVRTTLLSCFLASGLLGYLSLIILRDGLSGDDIRPPPTGNLTTVINDNLNYAVREEDLNHRRVRHVSAIEDGTNTVSVLLQDWEVLVIVSPESSVSSDSVDGYRCVFQNNATSPARFLGNLPFNDRTTFKCILPQSVRRLRPFLMPVLTRTTEYFPVKNSPEPELIRWNFLVYDSFSTENDVVVFAKGVNNRQGINRPPESLRCLFGDDVNGAVKTAVISSAQEVFRCQHPEVPPVSSGGEDGPIKISLEISQENRAVPSVASYTPQRTLAIQEPKSLLCACTMVNNVAKFLREWVLYHSKIGIEKFILYDNDSDDDLRRVVEELVQDGYNVKTLFWLWPKTQESGFSHCAIYAKETCNWMMYIDVDEFLFSPSWLNSSIPSTNMLKSLLPKTPSSSSSSSRPPVGQVSVQCRDFGPSNQSSHPIEGVTQGYTCRRKTEQRHKSIVLLDAIDFSLLNVIHHFHLKKGYRSKQVKLEDAIVNHYKYQAWSEFKAKFKRRVSAYVVDWTQALNPWSKDRTPGLGFAPIEPKGWAEMFCEVRDYRLKVLTHRWFSTYSQSQGYKMAWQR